MDGFNQNGNTNPAGDNFGAQPTETYTQDNNNVGGGYESTNADLNMNYNSAYNVPEYQQPAYDPNATYETYSQNGTEVNSGKDLSGVCVAALVCGCVSFFINPFYLVSIAAVIMGIIGQTSGCEKKNLAMWGWILGACGLIFNCIADIVITALTLGAGGFSFCC